MKLSLWAIVAGLIFFTFSNPGIRAGNPTTKANPPKDSLLTGAEQTALYFPYLKNKRINIQWMIDFYKAYPYKDKFFDGSQSKQIGNIDVLAGDYAFRKQITEEKTVKEIQDSWEPG